jgi:hypothetical protein
MKQDSDVIIQQYFDVNKHQQDFDINNNEILI